MVTAAHRCRDWTVRGRGSLPVLGEVASTASARAGLVHLVVACCGQGLLVGVTTGAVVGSAAALPAGPLVILGAVYGAAIGGSLAIPLTILIGGAITLVAARRHSPLRDPRHFHHDVWSVLGISVALIDGALLAVYARAIRGRVAVAVWLVVLLTIMTVTLLFLLRAASRRIVVAYARGSGWEVLRDDRCV